MAKATARCTCEKCGKEFIKIATKSNRREADSWEEWAESHFTICPECYAKECKEEEERKGLRAIFKWEVLTGYEIQVSITLNGNTYPIKEQLKAIGCRWNSCSYVWGRNLTVRDSELISDLKAVDDFTESLKKIGFEIISGGQVEESLRKYAKEKAEA